MYIYKNIIDKIELDTPFGQLSGLKMELYSQAINIVNYSNDINIKSPNISSYFGKNLS